MAHHAPITKLVFETYKVLWQQEFSDTNHTPDARIRALTINLRDATDLNAPNHPERNTVVSKSLRKGKCFNLTQPPGNGMMNARRAGSVLSAAQDSSGRFQRHRSKDIDS